MSTVWILGAGFSRSLGGPLFQDLFGPGSMENLEAFFPPADFRHLYPPAARVVHWLYNYGRRFTLGRAAAWDRDPEKDGVELWQDAEQYLLTLDNAASVPNSSGRRRLGRIMELHANRMQIPPVDLGEINGAARRLLAAECSSFTKDLDLASEAAIPYLVWARQLRTDHTILSFNYDRLLELLGNETDRIQCVVPGQKPRTGTALAYKLHGSVDWLLEDRVQGPQSVERSPDPFAAVNCELHSRLVIGSPGLTKSKITEMLHEKLWVPAFAALERATTIVFVGYRMPPTDNYAQKFILDAIRANRTDYVNVHVVLGCNTKSENSVRLVQLLNFALSKREEVPFGKAPGKGRCSLSSWPLYAADLLGHPDQEQITDPFKQKATFT